MTFVQKCDDGYIAVDSGTGYELPCCTNPWLAALYAAGFNESPCLADPPLTGNGRSHIVASISVRSDSPSGTTFDVALSFVFAVDDPDDPCTGDPDAPGGGQLYLNAPPDTCKVTLTAGYDTAGAWVHLTTLTGLTMDAEGSLGNTYTFNIPDIDVWINAFRCVDRFAIYGEPPEYGIPLQAPPPDIFNHFSQYDLQSNLPPDYPVKWQDAYDAATDYFSIDTVVDQAFGNLGVYVPGTISPQNSSYYDPSNIITLNVVPFIYPNPLEAAFWKALYITPRAKTIDDTFDLIVEGRNVYKGVKDTCAGIGTEADYGFPEPYMALVFPIDNEVIVWDSLTVEPCPQVDPLQIGYKWTFHNCQFLCKVGTKFLNVWHAYDGYWDKVVGNGLSQIYFDDPWYTKSGPIRVTVGEAKYYAVNYQPEGVTLVVYSSAPIRGTDTEPVQVRILDAAGMQSNRYNIVPTAVNLVTVALTETGFNYYTSPSLEGYTSDQLAAVAGVAEFSDLNIIGLGRNYRLTFTADSPVVTTGYDAVDISVAINLSFDQFGPYAAGATVDIVVNLIDHFSEILVPTSADDVILDGEGSFSGFGTVSPLAGVAIFTGSFPAPGTYDVFVKTSLDNYDGPNDDGPIPSVHISIIVT